LRRADKLLRKLGLEGEIQLASFHPDYQFADAPAGDVAHATNRAPWPTLHLIREDSIDRAVAAFSEAEDIYAVNQATMRRLGPEGWATLQARCRAEAEATAAPVQPTDQTGQSGCPASHGRA
jgi:hypothetical protein